MAQITGTGTIWNLPNYFGELFTADETETPFLSMIGGLNGGAQTANFEFPTGSMYDFPAATQPAITETASLTAPSATEAVRTQLKNVTQIFHQAVDISYVKLSNAARLSGINTAGSANTIADEKNYQIEYNLKIIARNVEYSFLRGTYAISTSSAVANKTRGMLAVCDDAASTDIAAGGVALTVAMMDAMFLAMRVAGAKFTRPMLWGSPKMVQAITALYEQAPDSRYEAGSNIVTIVTNFGNFEVYSMGHRLMADTDVLCADMAYINPITQPVPEKGNMFYEELAKTGAAEKGQLFGQIGLDHGPAFLHGKVSGIVLA